MDRSSACGESGEATSWASWGFFRGELALLIMATLVVALMAFELFTEYLD